ncbi:hypothetical protein [Deinococcus sp. AJ005]|uniref:hypothetical protein n=1 Tax=Deinococcus sp. AJ005 TaxID=2652443 RepID=UPI001CF7014A|nr:hypothetical protein [Deinococcus sp. AJ005]
MRPSDLTPTELADLLAHVYAADHGKGDDASNAAERTVLADYLGCHEDARPRRRLRRVVYRAG